MERRIHAGALIVAAGVAFGCRADKPTANATETDVEKRHYRFALNDEPLAVRLFRAGIEQQCQAAADKKARYLRGSGESAARMREEYRDRPLPNAEDLRRACVERNRARKIADDIVFALDVDIDRMHARAAELDANPYRDASGSIHPGHGEEEAWVEAIIGSDGRLTKASDRSAFCFVAALKVGVFVLAGAMLDTANNCESAESAVGNPDATRFLTCIVNAHRRAEVIECTTARDGTHEGTHGDLLTSDADGSDSEMSKPDLGTARE